MTTTRYILISTPRALPNHMNYLWSFSSLVLSDSQALHHVLCLNDFGDNYSVRFSTKAPSANLSRLSNEGVIESPMR